MKKLLLKLMLCLLSVGCFAKIVYVKTPASGANNGTSWANALGTIQAGIGAASLGDSVWIVKGTFKPTSTIILKNGVLMFGGFAGNESSLQQRNLILNPTIISGDVGVIGNPNDNTRELFKATSLSFGSVLDGFTIRDAYNGVSGGYGSAIVARQSDVTIRNCIITYNYARADGGAIYSNQNRLTIENTSFLYNSSSTNGGAIDKHNGNMYISDCVFTGNESINSGGGAINYQGGVEESVIDRCIFSGNICDGSGSAVAIGTTSNYDTIRNCLVVGNKSYYGSALFLNNNSLSGRAGSSAVINCTVAHNTCPTAASSSASYQSSIQFYGVNFPRVAYNNISWGNRSMGPISTSVTLAKNITDNAVITGNGNLNTNPQFVNPASGFNTAPFFASNYNYRLQALSPAIDAGSNAFAGSLNLKDVELKTRIYGGIVDMGCYELDYCTFLPQLSLSQDSQVCWGKSVTITAPNSTTYQWSNGSNTQSINVNKTGAYTVQLIDASQCRGKAIQSIKIDTAIANLTVIGSTSFCPGNKAVIKVADPGSYVWSNGNNSDSITVTATGNYYVTVTDPAGCKSLGNVFIQVANQSFPVNISQAQNTPCLGKKLQLTATGGKSYLWSTGSTDSSISVSSNAIYQVTISKNFCNTVAAKSITFPVQNFQLTATPDSVACVGDTITLSTFKPFQNFTWSSNSSASTLKATTSGNYFVTVTDFDSCISTGKKSLNFSKPSPLISSSGNLLEEGIGGFVAYQWYKNGNPLPGASQSQLVVTENGMYKVEVEDQLGCKGFSNEIQMLPLSLSEFVDTKSAVTAKNGKLHIDSQNGYNLKLFDVTGSLLFETNSEAAEIDVKHLFNRFCFAQVTFNDGKQIVCKVLN